MPLRTLTRAATLAASLAALMAECDRIGWDNAPSLEDWSSVEPPWPPYDAPEQK